MPAGMVAKTNTSRNAKPKKVSGGPWALRSRYRNPRYGRSEAANSCEARPSGDTLHGSTARQTTDRCGGACCCLPRSRGSCASRSKPCGCAARACAATHEQRGAGRARGAAASTRRACWCLQPKAAVAVHTPQLTVVSIPSHVAWSGGGVGPCTGSARAGVRGCGLCAQSAASVTNEGWIDDESATHTRPASRTPDGVALSRSTQAVELRSCLPPQLCHAVQVSALAASALRPPRAACTAGDAPAAFQCCSHGRPRRCSPQSCVLRRSVQRLRRRRRRPGRPGALYVHVQLSASSCLRTSGLWSAHRCTWRALVSRARCCSTRTARLPPPTPPASSDKGAQPGLPSSPWFR